MAATPEHNETRNPAVATGGNTRLGRERNAARETLASGRPRDEIRRELAAMREAELLRLLHAAAVMDSSPFWREIALRRFIRGNTKGSGEADGR